MFTALDGAHIIEGDNYRLRDGTEVRITRLVDTGSSWDVGYIELGSRHTRCWYYEADGHWAGDERDYDIMERINFELHGLALLNSKIKDFSSKAS